jgi:hypothetical protein
MKQSISDMKNRSRDRLPRVQKRNHSRTTLPRLHLETQELTASSQTSHICDLAAEFRVVILLCLLRRAFLNMPLNGSSRKRARFPLMSGRKTKRFEEIVCHPLSFIQNVAKAPKEAFLKGFYVTAKAWKREGFFLWKI